MTAPAHSNQPSTTVGRTAGRRSQQVAELVPVRRRLHEGLADVGATDHDDGHERHSAAIASAGSAPPAQAPIAATTPSGATVRATVNPDGGRHGNGDQHHGPHGRRRDVDDEARGRSCGRRAHRRRRASAARSCRPTSTRVAHTHSVDVRALGAVLEVGALLMDSDLSNARALRQGNGLRTCLASVPGARCMAP